MAQRRFIAAGDDERVDPLGQRRERGRAGEAQARVRDDVAAVLRREREPVRRGMVGKMTVRDREHFHQAVMSSDWTPSKPTTTMSRAEQVDWDMAESAVELSL